MKILFPAVIILLNISVASAEQPRFAMSTEGQTLPANAQATYADIKNTLGIVPTFLKQYPAQSITGAWKEMKALQISPDTAIAPKYKELIGLGVASQIPCKYCTIFHTEVAKFAGGTSEELNEAIAVAASCRHWSAYFNGIDYDTAKFRAETDQMMAILKERAQKNLPPPPTGVTEIKTAADARKDMEATMGIVPGFMSKFPDSALPGAWEDLKTLELSSTTALPPKYKALISLSVSAQIPCQKCVYIDTQMSKLNGATEAEIAEAITMSSITRRWSTVLNGQNAEEAAFRKEVSQIMAHLNEGKKKQK